MADLAIKTLEKCKATYAPVYMMLPPQVSALIQGVERRQDAFIAQLYNRSITFGRFNVEMNELKGKLWETLSGIPSQGRAALPPQTAETTPQIPLQPAAIASVTAFHDRRLALVIGNSNYKDLPKLTNPAHDAASIANSLIKMGYQTQLVLDAPEDKTRNVIRKFASESESADVAIVYYAGMAHN
jgi:hypothetical protein